MAELRWTDESATWLREIFDYIAADDPASASGVVEGIYERAQILREYPQLGYRYESIRDR